MAKILNMNSKTVEADNWLDNVKEEQRVNLKDFVGKGIEIKKGFCYDSKTYGRGFTFLFQEGVKEYYATCFGTAIVRQAEEQIIPALEEDTVIVKVGLRTSKKFKSEYLCFETWEDA